MVGKVDGEHVHRYPANQAPRLAVDEHKGAVGGVARIAIGVAHGDHADALATLGAVARAVADRFAGRQVADADHLRF